MPTTAPAGQPAIPAQELASFTAAYVTFYVLAAIRVLGAIAFNPLLGSARVPMAGRVGLGLFATLVLFPVGGPFEAPASVGPLQVASELLVGLMAGFAVTLVFGAVQFAAGLIGVNSGFSFAQTINPVFEHGGVIETFFTAFALLVFIEINGHHLFLIGLRELFDAVPVGEVTKIPGSLDKLIELSGNLFSAGVKLALPVMAALLMADLAIALLARVAPPYSRSAPDLVVIAGVSRCYSSRHHGCRAPGAPARESRAADGWHATLVPARAERYANAQPERCRPVPRRRASTGVAEGAPTIVAASLACPS